MEFKNLQQEELYRITAEKIGVSEELVKYVVSHMFSQARTHITNPQKSKVVINTFGVFSPKVKKLRTLIEIQKRNGNEDTDKYRDLQRILKLTTKQEEIKKDENEQQEL